MTLVRVPAANRPGLAVLPAAVTRGEYADFVAATGHVTAGCRIRTAMVTLKKRTWERPGFDQQGNHPVVCISAADASAYAAWLGKRDGQTYRLPGADDWRSLGMANVTPVCTGRCDGTRAISTGPMAAHGLRSLAGSAREWSSECRENCAKRLSLGRSWRDASGKDHNRDVDEVESINGYDDIGFRLLRDVARAETEQR
jgi:formylglycine-generating enzyme required for sulfatase activity